MNLAIEIQDLKAKTLVCLLISLADIGCANNLRNLVGARINGLKV